MALIRRPVRRRQPRRDSSLVWLTPRLHARAVRLRHHFYTGVSNNLDAAVIGGQLGSPTLAPSNEILLAPISGSLGTLTGYLRNFSVVGHLGTARYKHALAYLQYDPSGSFDYVYVLGGTTGAATFSDSIELLIFGSGSPVAVSDTGYTLATARNSHTAAFIGDYLFVAGGNCATGLCATIERTGVTAGVLDGSPTTYASGQTLLAATGGVSLVTEAFWFVVGGVGAPSIVQVPVLGGGELGPAAAAPYQPSQTRVGAQACIFNDRLYVYGGEVSGEGLVESAPLTDGAISGPFVTGGALSWRYAWASIATGATDSGPNTKIYAFGTGTTDVASEIITEVPTGDLPDTPPAPIASALSDTSERITGIAFDGSWDSLVLRYWRVGYESAYIDETATESTNIDLLGLITGQPYLCAWRATNEGGTVQGPSTGFTPGVVTPDTAPDAPGEITVTKLTDVYVRLEMPALPANADSLRLKQGGAVIATGLAGNAVYVVLGLTELTDYVFKAQSVNAYGQTDGPELLVTTESTDEQNPDPEDDISPPLVAWVAPADLATVGGIIRLRAQASDDTGVAEVRFYVNNVQQGDTQTEETYPSNTPTDFSLLWDARSTPNGTKFLRVEAEDLFGNITSDTIQVTLGNSIINNTGWWVSPVHSTGDEEPRWKTEGQYAHEVLFRTQAALVAEDDAFNFDWEAMALPGGVLPAAPLSNAEMSEAVALAVPLKNGKYVPVIEDKQRYFRLIVRRSPRTVWSTFEHAALAAIRLHPFTDASVAKVGVLTTGPNKIFTLSGEVLTQSVDLSALTDYEPVDLVRYEDMWHVAMVVADGASAAAYPHIRVIDPATGRLAYKIEIPASGYVTKALAVTGTGTSARLWFGTDNGAGSGKVYVWDGKSPALVPGTLAGVRRLTNASSATTDGLFAGTGDGKVYAVSSTAATLLNSTGEDKVLSLLRDGSLALAGSSTGGKLFTNRSGAWALEQDFTGFSELRALALHGGAQFAAGNAQEIWKRGASAWIQVAGADDLPNVSAINDMISYNSKLLIATTCTDGLLTAREQAGPVRPGAISAQLLSHISFEARYKKTPAA